MKMRCESCKWWGDSDSEDWGPPQYAGGDCHQECRCPFVGGGSYNDHNRRKQISLNTYESVGTGPRFGCVHWKKMGEI